MLKTFTLACKLLWREWRFGEWFVIFFALLFAITVITAMGFFTDRIHRGLEQQGTKFLGGDLVITSPTVIPESWKKAADHFQLQHAEVWSYASMMSIGKTLQLISLQAVSANYPLVGEQTLHLQPFTAWIEPRLFILLATQINARANIGSQAFQLTRRLTPDIDMLNTGWTIAPRVLIRLADVPATQTVLPGSRIDYRLLLVGEKNQLESFRRWITPLLQPSQALLDIHNQKFALLTVLAHTENYLQLILLACLIMSGVAIALSVQQYLQRHYADIALWRCLGASQQQITHIIFYQLLVMALIAGLIGITLGYLTQLFFANLFKTFLVFALPPAGIAPILLGFLISIFLLITFASPIITTLPNTSALYIWRREFTTHYQTRFVVALGFIGTIGFVYWFLNYSVLASYFLATLVASIFVLSFIGYCMLYLLRLLLPYMDGVFRRGFSQLIQSPKNVILQFVGLTLILMSFMVTYLVKTHLLTHWQQTFSQDTPNYFAINIAPTDLASLQHFFQAHHLPVAGMYPMVRGRLISLNTQPILTAVPLAAHDNNALHRELNLSWMINPPPDNAIVTGPPFTAADIGKPRVSVENKLAQDLQLKRGDTLIFQIGDKKLAAIVTNFRTVDWSSFHPNFFMIFPPGVLNYLPTTYITSFHLAADQVSVLNALVQLFPNVTIIDVASLLMQVQTLLNKMSIAIQSLFIFALGASILIFITSVQASLDERRVTYRLLRILGAGKKYLWQSVAVEFGILFFLIVLASVCISWSLVYALEQVIFV